MDKVILLTVLLTGCSTTYTYKHTNLSGDSCELVIETDREMAAAGISISKFCEVTGSASEVASKDIAGKVTSAVMSTLLKVK